MSLATSLSQTAELANSGDRLPEELVELREKIRSQPREVRAELEPLIEDALEHAVFRQRVLTVARDALQRLRLDLAMSEFDREALRSEHETRLG
jgi:hypothetical protein